MTRGLTLIELVVAMAVFALVAVMGLQSLSGGLRLRDSLTGRAEATDALGQATALLRNDLSTVVPMLFFPPDGSPPLSALRDDSDGQGFALSIGGQPGLSILSGQRDAAPWQRAEWRLEETRLTRRVWPGINPAPQTPPFPDVEVLSGVTALELRSYWKGQGWIDGLRQIRPESGELALTSRDGDAERSSREMYTSTLPNAVEITLETNAYGRIVLLEFLQ